MLACKPNRKKNLFWVFETNVFFSRISWYSTAWTGWVQIQLPSMQTKTDSKIKFYFVFDKNFRVSSEFPCQYFSRSNPEKIRGSFPNFVWDTDIQLPELVVFKVSSRPCIPNRKNESGFCNKLQFLPNFLIFNSLDWLSTNSAPIHADQNRNKTKLNFVFDKNFRVSPKFLVSIQPI